jgi:hypothetical protein
VAHQGYPTQTSTYESFYFPKKYDASNAIDGSTSTLSQTDGPGKWTLTFDPPIYLVQINILLPFDSSMAGATLTVNTSSKNTSSVFYLSNATKQRFSLIQGQSPIFDFAPAQTACWNGNLPEFGYCEPYDYTYPRHWSVCTNWPTANDGERSDLCIADFGEGWTQLGGAGVKAPLTCSGVKDDKGLCVYQLDNPYHPYTPPSLQNSRAFYIKQYGTNNYLKANSSPITFFPIPETTILISKGIEQALEFQFVDGWLRHVQSGLFISYNGFGSQDICTNPEVNYALRLLEAGSPNYRVRFEDAGGGQTKIRLNCSQNVQYYSIAGSNLLYTGSGAFWQIEYI